MLNLTQIDVVEQTVKKKIRKRSRKVIQLVDDRTMSKEGELDKNQ